MSTCLRRARLFIVIEAAYFRQHALVQNTGNQDTASLLPIEHDVASLFHATQTRTNVIAPAALRGMAPKTLTAGFQAIDVASRLDFAPFLKRVLCDVRQVGSA